MNFGLIFFCAAVAAEREAELYEMVAEKNEVEK